MAGQRITNSFEGGMSGDLDNKLLAKNTFKVGINGRLIYNEEGTLSFQNNKGNVLSVSRYGSEYNLIGKAEFADFVILFSIKTVSNVKKSEIGYIIFNNDGVGVYTKLFNDVDDDPYNDRYNFSTKYPIQAVPFYESDTLIRTYWTDDFNEPRVITIEKTGVNQYQMVTDSVFMSGSTPDWNMGEFNFKGRIDGSLRTGIYQYSYRCVTKDGYQTPWSPVTYPIINTGKKYMANSEQYGMGNVDEIGVIGHLIRIEGLDFRYEKVEIAYTHAIIADGVKEAGIFAVLPIDGQTYIDVRHTSIENITPIEVTELTDVKDVFSKVRTIQIKDNRLWYGNVEYNKSLVIPDEVLEGFYVEPEFRACGTDFKTVTGYGVSNYHGNTNGFQAVVPGGGGANFKKRKFQRFDGSGTYEVSVHPNKGGGLDDYVNYQSAQTCHSFTGYFRGETYRFAVVFFDKKGYPFFAKHFADVTMPEHTLGYFESALGNDGNDPRNYINGLTAQRVREDGTTQYKKIEIGNQVGVPTETNDVNDTGDRVLAGKAVARHGGQPTIESQYQIAHNSPVNGSNIIKPTKQLFTDPNDNDTANELNTSNYYNQYKFANARILGLRFGGIDLSVEIDGVPLYDLISGVSIVRAERLGADEQIKDTGVILNCQRGGTDTSSRAKGWILSTPLTGGVSSVSKNVFNFRAKNEGGGQTENLDLLPHAYTFDSIKYKITREIPKVNQGVTQIKPMYIAHTNNTAYGQNNFADAGLLGVRGALDGDGTIKRHYVSKNLNTYNPYALTNDSSGRWVQCTKYANVQKIIDIPNGGNNYGYIANHIIGTEAWMASIDDVGYRRSLDIWFGYDGSKDSKWFRGRAASSLIIETSFPYLSSVGNTTHVDGNRNSKTSVYVAALVERNPQPYGGLRNESLQNTRFHTTGHFLSVDETVKAKIKDGGYVLNEMEVWGGDCYLDAFSYTRILPVIEYDESCKPQANGDGVNDEQSGDGTSGGEFRDWAHSLIVPIESKYNFRLTYKDDANGVPTWAHVGTNNAASMIGDADKNYHNPYSSKGIFESSSSTCPDKLENFQLQDALLYTDRVRTYVTKPEGFLDIKDYPSRWCWSNEKQPYNVNIDSFRQFEELSNYDLDATYGEVVGNEILGQQLYSLQSRAFGRLKVGDRAVVTTPQAGDLVLGEGGIMDGIDYISKEFGTQHRDSIVSTGRAIYWVDSLMRKIMRFAGDGLSPLSDIKGLHNFVQPYINRTKGYDMVTDNYGIRSAYDFDNNDVIFTIKNGVASGEEYDVSDVSVSSSEDITQNLTILYNEDLGAFHGVHTYYPTVYFNYGKFLYSNRNNGTGGLYRYNSGNKGQYFNLYYYSVLNIKINDFPNMVKKFDNQIFNINEEGLSTLRKVSLESEGVAHTYPLLAQEITNLTGYQSVAATGNYARAKYREGLLRFPLREPSSGKPRLSGKHLNEEIWIRNDSRNLLVSITSIDTVVRLHNRK